MDPSSDIGLATSSHYYKGSEFIGSLFKKMFRKNGIESVPTTIKNPQGNSIAERLHKTISTMIAISIAENPPTTPKEAADLVRSKCAAAQYAVRATNHKHLKH